MKNKNSNFTVPIIVLSLATIGLFIAYAITSSSDYQNVYYSSVAQSAVSGSVQTQNTINEKPVQVVNNPSYEAKDFELDDLAGKVIISWKDIQAPNLSYTVEYAAFDNALTTGSYASALGTISNLQERKTLAGKQYFIGDLPSQFAKEVISGKSGLINGNNSATDRKDYLFDGLLNKKTYVAWVKTYENGSLSSFSKNAVVFTSDAFLAEFKLPFEDVTKTDWFYDYVSYIYQKGIVDAAQSYFPARNLNRAEAVKLVSKAIKAEVTADDAKFAAQKFIDIKENDWFAGYVGYMARRNWIQGTPVKENSDTFEFKGNDGVTRAQMLKIMSLAFGGNTEGMGKQLIFNDVPVNSWFAPYVEYSYKKGIIADSPGMIFYPERVINRAEIAKILTLALQSM